MAAPAPEPPSGGLLAELTPFERTFVLKQRSMEVISGFLFPFQGSAWLQSYLDLCGGEDDARRGRERIAYLGTLNVLASRRNSLASTLNKSLGKRTETALPGTRIRRLS